MVCKSADRFRYWLRVNFENLKFTYILDPKYVYFIYLDNFNTTHISRDFKCKKYNSIYEIYDRQSLETRVTRVSHEF